MKQSLLISIIFVLFLISGFAQTKEALKIDEFGLESCDNTTSHLDTLLPLLQENPTAKVYIISYDGYYISSKRRKKGVIYNLSAPRVSFFKKHLDRRRGYIYDNDGRIISDDGKTDNISKIIYANGGYRDKYSVEVWLVPEAAALPKSTPTVNPKDNIFKGLKVVKESIACIEGDGY